MAKKQQNQEGQTALAEPSPQHQQEALTKVQEQPTALATAEQIDDMFGGSGYQIPIDAPLPQVVILRETPKFETPEGETVKEIVGHIIYWHHANQYYAEEFGEGEAGPPTCASPDGINPLCTDEMEQQDHVCRSCPKNQYGSASEGKGKACQNTIRLYVLAEGEVIPCVIKASPASLGKKESLMKWLTNAPNIAAKAGAGTKYQLIRVKFTLHTRDFETGFKASVLDLETVGILNPQVEADMVRIVQLGKLYGEFMTNYMDRIQDDVASEHLKAEPEIPFGNDGVQEADADADNVPI